MMRRTTVVLRGAIVAMTLALSAAELSAQQRGAGPWGRDAVVERLVGAPARGGVEAILRMRERLELTQDQVTRLDALRAEEVERRAAQVAQMNEFRSQARAGTLDRGAAADRLRDIREARRVSAEEHRAQVEALLTEAQRDTLRQLQAQRRAFEAGRRSIMRERVRAPRGDRWAPEGRGRG